MLVKFHANGVRSWALEFRRFSIGVAFMQDEDADTVSVIGRFLALFGSVKIGLMTRAMRKEVE